jgi:hypothetical protein
MECQQPSASLLIGGMGYIVGDNAEPESVSP